MEKAYTNLLWRKQILPIESFLRSVKPPYDTLSVRSECPKKLLTILAKPLSDKMTLKKVINKVINISKQGDIMSVDNF